MSLREQCFFVSCVMVAIAGAISSIEYLQSFRLFGEEGILSWRVVRTAYPKTKEPFLATINTAVFDAKGVRFLLILRVIISVLLPFLYAREILASSMLCALLLLQLMLSYRTVFGSDGSDQMLTILAL